MLLIGHWGIINLVVLSEWWASSAGRRSHAASAAHAAAVAVGAELEAVAVAMASASFAEGVELIGEGGHEVASEGVGLGVFDIVGGDVAADA